MIRGSGFSKPIAGVFLHPAFELLHVPFANRRLCRQAVQLRPQNGRLKSTQAVIEADDAVVKLVRQAGASGVDIALDDLQVFEVVGDHSAAFAAGDELARLEAERAEVSHRAGAFSFPLSAVRVGAILDDFQFVFCGDAQNFVHIGKRMPRCTGRIALVFGVMAFSMSLASRQ